MTLRSRLAQLEAATAPAGPYLSSICYQPGGPDPDARYYPDGWTGWLDAQEAAHYWRTGELPDRYKDAPTDRPGGPLVVLPFDAALETLVYGRVVSDESD